MLRNGQRIGINRKCRRAKSEAWFWERNGRDTWTRPCRSLGLVVGCVSVAVATGGDCSKIVAHVSETTYYLLDSPDQNPKDASKLDVEFELPGWEDSGNTS